jgi:methyltransferase (TIGR00027 family)
MDDGLPSFTAMTAAAARAAHLIVDGEPVIFADTLASALLGERAEELLSYHTSHGTHPVLAGARVQVTCRGRYTEDALARAAGRGVTQYVVLGAGLDSFAYRSGGRVGGGAGGRQVRVFEVDHPATQDWKRRALAHARVTVPDGVAFVPADLAADAPADLAADTLPGLLAAAGFDGSAPALVGWLGVTMYLTRDAIAATLVALGGLAPGSEVIADYMLPAKLRDDAGAVYGSLVAQASAERGEPWLSCLAPEEMADLARAAGFAAVRNVPQRDAIPAALWQRSDALCPADLAMLLHGTVPPRG